ncbi:winged helix-turn-helix transcriptional regulator [Candidatus Bathyarchaeota archaeon]|nr:winged helix-turn-helix transcriptional regulator [Candidatus Bathyarchaeota archaeon]
MKELDQKIIEYLVDDARMSFRQIAKNTDKSTDTIINHYNKLMEEGIIRGSTIVLNPHEINYEGIAAFEIDVSSNHETTSDKILKQLIEMPNVIVATKTVGEHDLLALTVIHNLRHYQEISEEISQIRGIKNQKSNIWTGNKHIHPKYFII